MSLLLYTSSDADLLIDDEKKTRFLAKGLNSHFEGCCPDGETARSWKEHRYDLMIIDVMLPERRLGRGGTDRRRYQHPNFSSPPGQAGDRVRGLELGADDYPPAILPSPNCSPASARYCDVLGPPGRKSAHRGRIDTRRNRVVRSGIPLNLTPKNSCSSGVPRAKWFAQRSFNKFGT
jgi:hypothetical protein